MNARENKYTVEYYSNGILRTVSDSSKVRCIQWVRRCADYNTRYVISLTFGKKTRMLTGNTSDPGFNSVKLAGI
jgi:hypothetical protein